MEYDGPPLSLSDQDTVLFGQSAYALAAATGTRRSWYERAADQERFVIDLAGRLTDAHVDAAFRAAGLGDDASVQELRRKAQAGGGLAAYLRSHLAGNVRFDALGCALGIAEIVVGVGGIVVAGAKEVGSAAILTPAAAFTAAVSGAWIAEGAAVAVLEC